MSIKTVGFILFIVLLLFGAIPANATEYIPPVPTIGTVTTGNFWVNTTWVAGSVVIDSYSESNQDSWNQLSNGARTRIGQAFRIINTDSLTKTKFYLQKVGTPTGTIVSKLYASTGTVGTNAVPTGAALATSDSVDVSTIPSSTFTLITFNFSNPYTLSANTNYTITVEFTGGDISTNYISVGDDESSSSHGGNEFYWDGVVWGTSGGYGSWDSIFSIIGGNITNSYNVSVNGAWTNGTTNTFHNSTLSAHAWHNITAYAWNSSGGGTLNTTALINNTQIPNNVPVQQSIGAKSVNENEWLNFSISTTDADGDSLTYGTNASKGTLTTNSFSWKPTYSDSGVYTWYFNTTDNYSAVATETIIVTVNNVNQIPPVPVINSTMTGNFYMNTTWTAGAGNVTDSYNVSTNGVWNNGSATTFKNTTLSAHAWQNLTVYAWNSTDNVLSSTALTNNTQVPNNAPTLGSSSISAASIYPVSQSLTITVENVNDTDNDNITGVTVGITYLGSETNYTMTNTANTTTWTKTFSTGVSGFYTVTAFYATDNYTATTKKTASHAFEVVTQLTGGTSGGGSPGAPATPTPTSTPTTNITIPQGVEMISLPTIAQDPIGKIILEAMVVIGAVLIIFGLDKGAKIGTLLTGIVLIGASSWSLGWLV